MKLLNWKFSPRLASECILVLRLSIQSDLNCFLLQLLMNGAQVPVVSFAKVYIDVYIMWYDWFHISPNMMITLLIDQNLCPNKSDVSPNTYKQRSSLCLKTARVLELFYGFRSVTVITVRDLWLLLQILQNCLCWHWPDHSLQCTNILL